MSTIVKIISLPQICTLLDADRKPVVIDSKHPFNTGFIVRNKTVYFGNPLDQFEVELITNGIVKKHTSKIVFVTAENVRGEIISVEVNDFESDIKNSFRYDESYQQAEIIQNDYLYIEGIKPIPGDIIQPFDLFEKGKIVIDRFIQGESKLLKYKGISNGTSADYEFTITNSKKGILTTLIPFEKTSQEEDENTIYGFQLQVQQGIPEKTYKIVIETNDFHEIDKLDVVLSVFNSNEKLLEIDSKDNFDLISTLDEQGIENLFFIVNYGSRDIDVNDLIKITLTEIDANNANVDNVDYEIIVETKID